MKPLVIPILLVSASCSLTTAADAQTTATVIRSTDLKAKPFTDAESLRPLKENEKLNVLSRKASWTEVKAQEQAGWVKMLSLRFDGGTNNVNVGTIFSNAVELSKGSVAGSTTTTAVKGWVSKDNFKNLKPDPEKLQQALSFSVTAGDAKAFANQEKLQSQEQAYVKGEGAKK